MAYTTERLKAHWGAQNATEIIADWQAVVDAGDDPAALRAYFDFAGQALREAVERQGGFNIPAPKGIAIKKVKLAFNENHPLWDRYQTLIAATEDKLRTPEGRTAGQRLKELEAQLAQTSRTTPHQLSELHRLYGQEPKRRQLLKDAKRTYRI